ncbi:MAG: hypothetical protein KAV87_54315 [Desulfobacteraceae bacterium]|nr:hypothetical protein [Desulfobacteraceae bacterium]
MKLGIAQIYNEKDWISYTIDHAMKICDKLLIVEGARFLCFDDLPARSDDGTLDIISDKMKEYSNRIEVWPDGCDKGSFRENVCANNQAALDRIKIDDHFILCESDEFYTDSFIDDMNEAMREGDIDCMNWTGLQFVFGFKWVFAKQAKLAFLKKVLGAHFSPLYKPRGFGSHHVTVKKLGCLHYSWVKTRERMLRRARIGIYDRMPEWFASNYDRIELAEGTKINYVDNQVFTLNKYEGAHSSLLDNHPWRHIEDIRKIKI